MSDRHAVDATSSSGLAGRLSDWRFWVPKFGQVRVGVKRDRRGRQSIFMTTEPLANRGPNAGRIAATIKPAPNYGPMAHTVRTRRASGNIWHACWPSRASLCVDITICTLHGLPHRIIGIVAHHAKLIRSRIQGPRCTRELLKCIWHHICMPRGATETFGEKLRERFGVELQAQAEHGRAPAAPKPGGADGQPLDEEAWLPFTFAAKSGL